MIKNKKIKIKNNLQSIGDLIIAQLLSCKSSRRFYKIIKERELARYKKESVRVSLSRLNKKGYVFNSSGSWGITTKGQKHYLHAIKNKYIRSPFKKEDEHNTILSFDIPENNRKTRNWLRNQLKIFGYKMFQQSLWLGPGPLPSNFLKKLTELKIRENIKIFKIKN